MTLLFGQIARKERKTMRSVRGVIKATAALGTLAACWLAGAAPVWQGFGLHGPHI